MMDTIPCQACKPEDSGCPNCGGFKVKLERITCQCGSAYWDWPRRGFTIYEGKRYPAFDGTEVIVHLDRDNECSKCEGQEIHSSQTTNSGTSMNSKDQTHTIDRHTGRCECGKFAFSSKETAK